MNAVSELRAKRLLTRTVLGLYLAGCVLPMYWGRGGFLEAGTVLPGWVIILGLPPLCCQAWPMLAAQYVSMKWLWQDRYRGAFLLACLNLLPSAPGLAALFVAQPPGYPPVLRIGYYVWLTALVVWMLGVGILWLQYRGKRPLSAKEKSALEEL